MFPKPSMALLCGYYLATGRTSCGPAHQLRSDIESLGSGSPFGMTRFYNTLTLLLLLLTLPNCATRQQHIDDYAQHAQFTRDVTHSDDGLSLLTYTNHAYQKRNSLRSGKIRDLHIYLEGDGIPWIRPRIIAVDPTPKTAMALRLMRLDPHASLYLGRPCYHGFYQQRGCHPILWTQARYSDTVVNALLQGLRSKLQRDAKRMNDVDVTLIGYSGGGVLAMLMAQRLSKLGWFHTLRVVTLSANLDVAAWARLHHYSPLTASRDPAAQATMFRDIEQWHFTGERDKNIPPALISPLKTRFGVKAHWLSLPDADHVCCWEQHWPKLLQQLDANQKP